LKTAISAYMQLSDQLRAVYPLVVIGMKGWRTEALESQMAPMIHTGQIRQLGYVSRPDLVALMSGARCLVYPSIYEGFGLPPLESMACGTPVICSNVSSLPEVVGDAGVMVDPLDDVALAEAMRRMIEDDKEWSGLKKRSLEQAEKFTWQNCAKNTVEVYSSVVR
jgi:alpha-1,3-rhamnosyl/mannosyltransferase